MKKDRFMGIALAAVAVGVIAFAVFSPVPKAKVAYASDNKSAEQQRQEQIEKDLEAVVAQSVPANKTVNVDGVSLKTSIEGLYLAKSVSGVAVNNGAGQVAAAIGASGNDKLYVQTWDVTSQKSPAAIQATNLLAQSLGAVVGPSVQINIGKKTGSGVDYSNQSAKVLTTVGIPAGFNVPGAKYGVIRVASAGQFEILPALGTSATSVSFLATSGQGVYTLVRLP